MIADDIDDLNQKINKKFIRNVIKPMAQMQRRGDDLPFQIPSASELFGYPMSGPALPPPPRGGSLPVPRHPRDEYASQEDRGAAPLRGGRDHVPFQPSQYGSYYPEDRPPRRRMIRHNPDIEEEYHSPRTPVATASPAPPPPTPVPINCVAICGHVQSCPVCSQLYRPYTGIYLAVIVILIIVILFLLKRIFQF